MPIEVVVAQSVHHHQSRKQDLAEQAFTLARRQSSWLDVSHTFKLAYKINSNSG